MPISHIIASVALIAGAFFTLVAAIGVVRLPDILMRMHASTKAGTLGTGFILLAVAVTTPGLRGNNTSHCNHPFSGGNRTRCCPSDWQGIISKMVTNSGKTPSSMSFKITSTKVKSNAPASS